MDFILLTPEQHYTILKPIRVKAYLKNGVVEILDGHQFLMGLIENNLIFVESFEETKKEQFFVVQDAIFIVSDQGMDPNDVEKRTTVYVYAKTLLELKKDIPRETFIKYYENKKNEFEQELTKMSTNNKDKVLEMNLVLNSKALLLKEELEFFRNVLTISERLNQIT